jgi:hypothetical protein
VGKNPVDPTPGSASATNSASSEAGALVPRRGFGAWLNSIGEKRFANRRSRELLELYQQARGREPLLSGKTLYVGVVMQAGYDAKEAQAVVRRAEQSFCAWPAEHDLRFSDVVRYMVVTEYLRSHPGAVGIHTNVETVVARVIRADL